MSESLKFGPEWLRNTISTSPPRTQTCEAVMSHPILSEIRYSREEMCSIFEGGFLRDGENSVKYESIPHVWYREEFQMPMNFRDDDSKRTYADDIEDYLCGATNNTRRIFINSQLKQNAARGGSSKPQWRNKQPGEKSKENWRFQKDSGGSGVYFNNTYSE